MIARASLLESIGVPIGVANTNRASPQDGALSRSTAFRARCSRNTSTNDPRYRELNAMTLSGRLKLVRLGDWKLVVNTFGRGELYHLPADPAELLDRYDDPACREVRQQLTDELVRWMIRTEDDLPLDLSVPKWAPRNWYTAASSPTSPGVS